MITGILILLTVSAAIGMPFRFNSSAFNLSTNAPPDKTVNRVDAAHELIYGMTVANSISVHGIGLVSFFSDSPGVIDQIGPFTGVVANHTLRSIDFRPATGQLYALSANANNSTAQLYTVNLATAALTTVGSGFSLGSNVINNIEMDFDPVADRIRIITASDLPGGFNNNFRVNPNDGTLAAIDTNLAYAPGDPGNQPFIFNMIGAAYSNNIAGTTVTTLYSWDYQTDALVTIGGLNGTPSPNGGQMFTVSRPASFLVANAEVGIDISGSTGIMYVTHDAPESDGAMRLSIRDTMNGSMTLAGAYPAEIFVGDLSVFIAPGGAPTPTPTPTGSPTPTPMPVISGKVTYENTAVPMVPVAGTNLIAVGTPNVFATTDLSGDYSLSGFGAGSYTVTLSKPDILASASNGIFSNDAALISRHVVGLTTLNATQLKSALVAGQATLTALDAGLVAQWIVGIPNGINQTGKWKFTPINRMYASVTTSQTAQDHTAILLGDVSGDWSPAMRPAEKESDGEKPVTVSMPDLYAAPATTITVPLSLVGLRGREVTSYQFDVEYDPAVLAPEQAAAAIAGTLSEGLTAVSNTAAPGLLKVVVFGPMPVSGDGVYAELRFSVIGKLGSSTPLIVTNFRFNDGVDDVTVLPGSVTIGDMSGPVLSGGLLTE